MFFTGYMRVHLHIRQLITVKAQVISDISQFKLFFYIKMHF